MQGLWLRQVSAATFPSVLARAPHMLAARTAPALVRSIFGLAGGRTAAVEPPSSTKEANANRALSNPEVQAEFYQHLLSAKYPQLVVSRYEAPAVARNAECDRLYSQALVEMGRRTAAEAFQRSRPASFGAATEAGVAIPNTAGGHFNPLSAGPRGTTGDPIYVVAWSRRSIWTWVIPLALLPLVVFGVSYFADRVTNVFKEVSNNIGDHKVEAVRAESSNVKFKDVLGVDEARSELKEIVEFLKDPSKFTGLGGKLPKGVLLTGPPGTGKTLLARAVAGEAGVPFFFMSGSEFDEVFVGVGAKRIRELFAAARAKAPAIVFIDELDAIGGKRNPRDQAYSKQTLNQLLVDLDGFNQSTGVIFLAATNFPEMLDKALTRPGRFDKQVQVDLPDVRGRDAILKHYLGKVEAGKDVSTIDLARGTPGFSGADISNLVNQAAIFASQQRARAITTNHLEWAKDKILLGAERKTMVMTEETRRNTAFHEAGHAIMAMYTRGATPLYKATILPRGSALGITFQLPELDKYDQTRKELLARLDVCMGGRIAEEIVHGPEYVTSGCSSDLKNATAVAKAMVTSFGMSSKIGPVDLSQDWTEWSAGTRQLAEEEIRELLVASEHRTRDMLTSRNTELERLAHGLLEYETLDKEEMELIVAGKSIAKEKMCTNTVVKSDDIRDKRTHALAMSLE